MFNVKTIINRFVDYFAFAKNPQSNIFKLMQIFSDELIALEQTNKRILDWRDIDNAQGVALNLIGENINQPRGVATDEVYRILLKSKIARNLSDGSINTIIQVLSIALNTDPSTIKIIEKWNDPHDAEPAAISLIELPLARINEAGMDPINFVRIVQRTVAGGIKVGTIELEGTFEFGTTLMEADNEQGFADIDGTVGGYFGAVFSPSDEQELPI